MLDLRVCWAVWFYYWYCTRSRGYKINFMFNSGEMKFFLLINVKMPTIVGILTFMSTKNCIIDLSEHEKCWNSLYFYIYEHLKFLAQLSWAWKFRYNLGARFSQILFQSRVNFNLQTLMNIGNQNTYTPHNRRNEKLLSNNWMVSL